MTMPLELPVTVDVEHRSNGCRMKVSGVMSIYSAGLLRAQLIEPLRRRERLELDLSGVQEFDSAGVQLVYLLKREVEGLDGMFVLGEKSEAVRQVFGFYRMADDMGALACKGQR